MCYFARLDVSLEDMIVVKQMKGSTLWYPLAKCYSQIQTSFMCFQFSDHALIGKPWVFLVYVTLLPEGKYGVLRGKGMESMT